eukprot:6528109-Prymnesium_polylepis.1
MRRVDDQPVCHQYDTDRTKLQTPAVPESQGASGLLDIQHACSQNVPSKCMLSECTRESANLMCLQPPPVVFSTPSEGMHAAPPQLVPPQQATVEP